MKALVFGANGQVGTALKHTVPALVSGTYLTSSDCDIADAKAVREAVRDVQPQVIVNAAAYTAVDKAESDRDTAAAVNAVGPRNLAEAAAQHGARLIHISTDFVFDGSASAPIRPQDTTNPLGVYGTTKLQGENAALEANPDATTIVRTSWVYSATGNNFVRTMLRLMAEKDELSVVADQTGSPTWATSLAEAIWDFGRLPSATGIFHWSDAGATTWYDFAVEIRNQGLEAGLLQKEIPINPIASEQYPTPAARPAFSVLDCTSSIGAIGRSPAPWRENLRKMISELSS